jgi:hypothetical protein
MDVGSDDAFEKACHHLELIEDLKRKELLEDTEYKELRNIVLSEMKRSATLMERNQRDEVTTYEALPTHSLPYGQLHEQIVQIITATYTSIGATAKQRMFRAMSEMAEKRALHPGDSVALAELIEVVFSLHDRPLDELLSNISIEGVRQLLEVLVSLNKISTKIRDSKDTSPAAKAIAETTQQSATRAVEEFGIEQKKPSAKNTTLKNFWGKLILNDVEGAFEGGAASAAVFQAFTGVFPLTLLPVAAAFGVVIGAGVRSGIAYAERAIPG